MTLFATPPIIENLNNLDLFSRITARPDINGYLASNSPQPITSRATLGCDGYGIAYGIAIKYATSHNLMILCC